MAQDYAEKERARRQRRLDKWHASILLDSRASPPPGRLYVDLAFARDRDDMSTVVRAVTRRAALLAQELKRGRKVPATLPTAMGALELVGVAPDARLTCADEAAFDGAPLDEVIDDIDHPVWAEVPEHAPIRAGAVWAAASKHPSAAPLAEAIELRRTQYRWLALLDRRASFSSAWSLPGAKKLDLLRAGMVDVLEAGEEPLSALGLKPSVEARLGAALDQFTRRSHTLGSIPSAWVLRSQKGIGKVAINEVADALWDFARRRFGAWPGAERDDDEAVGVLDDGLGALADLFGDAD